MRSPDEANVLILVKDMTGHIYYLYHTLVDSNNLGFEPRYEKTCLLHICEGKGAFQINSNDTADQRFCLHYCDNTIPLLPQSKISRL